MRWLVHGKLTAAVGEALVRHGHAVTRPEEVGVPEGAPYSDVIEAARKNQLDVITADEKLVDQVYEADIWFQRSIVYLQLTGEDVEQDDAVDRLFARYKRLTPGRLYTVTETRVKVRQLPSKV